ncbi:uncharacterized protein FIBRA_07596 [Fibroporia radiculosa]|uniref:Uncharacterized protein n=1 Tax=Fibroporia radiculosa TaxID=599839 RepID=J4GVB2_9APHY|nr:uncharacterized protein FIBRA_07596 [Fibroporia radiculosa]CCM05380.1 predicted protein [Fibroporia radiculosa]
MPDSFFSASKTRKRKRSTGEHGTVHGTRSRRGSAARTKSKLGSASVSKRRGDEELSDATQEEDNAVGIDELDLRAPDVVPDVYESGEEDDEETPAEKRLRLAKLYLDDVKQDLGLAEGEFDAAEIDRELISARLKQDVMEHSGKVHLFVADIFNLEQPPCLRTRGHRFSVTTAVASSDTCWLFTAGKEGSIIKWNLHTGRKSHVFSKCRPEKGKGKAAENVAGHTDEVWALAVSMDGRYLASGGKDRRVGIWNVESNEWIKGFADHRDSISSLAFRKASPSASSSTQLYSGSFDRTLKLFDLTSMGYVETLFGHQAPVLSLDTLRNETAVSSGGRDKTVRYWKIPEETQLVFRGGGGSQWSDALDGIEVDSDGAETSANAITRKRKGKATDPTSVKFVEGSIECVAMIDETTFRHRSISLWLTQKKKPVYTQALAHGIDESQVDTEDVETVRKPRWVTAISSLRYSDLFASGSWDGEIRLWKLDSKLKSFSLAGSVSARGVINSLQFVTPSMEWFDTAEWARPSDRVPGKQQSKALSVLMIAGIGQETRFGRWVQQKGEGVLNGALVVALHCRT